MNIHFTVERVTPAIASRWLAQNVQNRALRPKRVEAWAREIREGRFGVSNDAICLSTTGRLLNGQHRLHAVVQTGIPVMMLVGRGYSEDSQEYMDSGIIRRAPDFGEFNFREIGTANAMRAGGTGFAPTLSASGQRAWAREHGDAIRFGVSCLAGRKAFAVQVTAVFARAYYTQDPAKLQAAGRILKTGTLEATDGMHANTLLRFRDLLSRELSGGGGTLAAVRYRKCETAIQAFLDGRTLGKIYEAATELYPLPGESGF